MNYWLLKSDPDAYSWQNLEKDQQTRWDGIRNFQARNNLRAMKKGDLAFFYHSQLDREIVGIVEITKEAYPDPTATEGDWSCIEIKLIKPVTQPIGLEEIRNTPGLGTMPLVTHSRLSVQTVSPAQWQAILKYTKTDSTKLL